jgi:hypothetical protein
MRGTALGPSFTWVVGFFPKTTRVVGFFPIRSILKNESRKKFFISTTRKRALPPSKNLLQ